MSKDAFLVRRLPTHKIELEAGTVEVRALSRAEAMKLPQYQGQADEAEVFILSAAVVDPQFSEDEVRQWRDGSPADEIGLVVDTILELSGLTEGAEKRVVNDAVRRFR